MADSDRTAPTLSLSESRASDDFAALLGTTLVDRYVLEERIGEGGFGVVFRARDTRLDKPVAVKVLARTVADNPASLARFEQEAVAAARIGHKGIVDVTDIDDDGEGTHFIVMELIEGCDLGAMLHVEGVLSLTRALSIAVRTAQALAAAHAKGIIHRDLKPANILLTNMGPVAEYPKVLDFGVSKMMRFDDADELTQDGQVVGTPRYMAPEQGMGNVTIDGRADVYALGSILYEMATGHQPFHGTTHYEVIHNKLSMDPLPPSVVYPDLEYPREIESLVFKALARNPEQRYATMAEFEVAIRELLEAIDPDAAAAVRPPEPTPQPTRRVRGESSSTSASTHLEKLTPATPLPTSPLSATVQAPPQRRWTAVAGVGLVVLAGGVFALISLRGGESDGREAEPGALVKPAIDAAAPADTTPEPEMVEIRLVLKPSDALVTVDGLVSAENPLRFPRSESTYEIVVSATGYHSEKRTLRPTASGELPISLKKEAQTKPKRPVREPDRPRPPDGPI